MKRQQFMVGGGLCAIVMLVPEVLFAAAPSPDGLVFKPDSYTTLRVTVDDAPMEVRRYHVVYAARPVRMAISQQGQMGLPPVGGAGVRPPAADGTRPANAAPTPESVAPLNGGPPPVSQGGPGDPRGNAGAIDPYAHQSMFIYVPQSAYNNPKAAIILQVNNAGWFASPVQDRVTEGSRFASTNDTDNTGAALKAGYVVVNAGTRSRGAKAENGDWAGKAPAVVVDAKAAVRYLRFNDALMPGSAERILITGTSGGGGLSVAVAASGNSPDYYPYLAEIGAAGIDASGKSTLRDDIFGVVAYCPINDLGHADAAYEWQYKGVRTAGNTNRGQYPPGMQAASAALAAEYPAYLASLKLRREDGTLLTTEALQVSILDQVAKGTQAGIDRGAVIPAIGDDFIITLRGATTKLKNDWLAVENGKVTSIDYRKYLAFVAGVTPLKGVPAFDSSANTGNRGVSGENTLFGSARLEYANFTEYSWNHNEVSGDGSGADDTGRDWAGFMKSAGSDIARQVRMVSPIPYLNTSADAAPYWYVRHGIVDRDTSFATQVVLYYAIKNDPSVKDLDFRLAWLQGHAGNYDVQEAYAWVADVLARAGDPAVPAAR